MIGVGIRLITVSFSASHKEWTPPVEYKLAACCASRKMRNNAWSSDYVTFQIPSESSQTSLGLNFMVASRMIYSRLFGRPSGRDVVNMFTGIRHRQTLDVHCTRSMGGCSSAAAVKPNKMTAAV